MFGSISLETDLLHNYLLLGKIQMGTLQLYYTKYGIMQNMDDNGYLTSAAIGHVAYKTLQTETDADGWGNTSKGFFMITDNKKVLFISSQTFKGPLTINTNEKLPERQILSHDTHILLSPNQIRFIQSDLEVRINPQTRVWSPTVQNKLNFNLEAFITRSNLIECKMITQLSNNHQARKDQANINDKLKSALSSRNEITIHESLSNLLGYGEGLTPSGDDYICGFLLAAHAWKEILFTGFTLQKIIRKIVDVAQEKTTTLSANLIDCAASGSADERIIRCINWLNSGGRPPAAIIEELLSYGSSSGLDTLAGILTFIQSSPIVD